MSCAYSRQNSQDLLIAEKWPYDFENNYVWCFRHFLNSGVSILVYQANDENSGVKELTCHEARINWHIKKLWNQAVISTKSVCRTSQDF